MFCGSQNHSAMPGILGGGVDTSRPQRRSVDYVIICVCVTLVTPFSISPSLYIPLYISGTRHRLHNASPPLRCRGGKQRHPASRNTATEAHEERAECLFMCVCLTER